MPPLIRELAPSTNVDAGYYAVVEARSHVKRDGGRFVRARLRDATGSIDAVAWDNYDETRAVLVPGRVVKVRGTVGQAYNGDGLELTIQRVRAARDEEYALDDLLPRSGRPTDELVEELRCLAESLPSTLKCVVWRALEPELERFKVWPGAAEIHHAWLSGLLEHSIEVAKLGEAIAHTVGGPDRDVVVAGALLHDVGKIDTYSVSATFAATDSGRLLGHVLTGFYRVQKACLEAGASEDVSLRLLHIIASHHGVPEYGAAREPMTAEAIVIHYADELSAQLMQVRDAISQRADATSRWTERVKGLRRDVFVGDNLPKD